MYQFTENISVFCLDELYPGGNKYYKLKYNILEAREQGATRFLSFGGAWSNHILALALMGMTEKFETIGVIRGERPRVLSPTLSEAESLGMKLQFVSRQIYRTKTDPELLKHLSKTFGDFYLLPEGGTNELAVRGASEIVSDLRRYHPLFDRLFLPVATGGTIAGIALALNKDESVTGISVLKGAEEAQRETEVKIAALIASGQSNFEKVSKPYSNWTIDHRFHCGGYAKCPAYLRDFILKTEQTLAYPLEPVYTGKMMWAISQMLDAGEIRENEKVVAIHTGGLQGRRGFPALGEFSP